MFDLSKRLEKVQWTLWALPVFGNSSRASANDVRSEEGSKAMGIFGEDKVVAKLVANIQTWGLENFDLL